MHNVLVLQSPVLNPFSHQVVGPCSTTSSQDCHDAIEAANKAFASWENTTPWQRRDILLKAADLISTEKYKRALITGQREETAATDGWGYGQWAVAQNFLRTTASMANELKGESFVSGSVAGAQVVTQRRALGVILAIAPWNAALTLTLRTIAVPILCGNTIVFKCSELSPRSQAIVADLFADAGLPPGVLNIISISRETAPELTAEIIAHPMVRKVAVLTVFMSVNTIDDAVEMANATTYSLSTALWTTNVHSAKAVAPRIRAGVTSVNGPTFHSEAYVGVIGLGGSSGYGRFDVENFTDKRLIISHPDWERRYPGLL
ncbi:ALDH-like protein [Pleurotus eryngii]|uniref:ALDH-like protein n=1 Tax=Pleurotus eryngii TaxID=5323 RepID=A0A9P5ZMW6_PLEER|nr:ALDH-like protein [Pleurotus eryngii]